MKRLLSAAILVLFSLLILTSCNDKITYFLDESTTEETAGETATEKAAAESRTESSQESSPEAPETFPETHQTSEPVPEETEQSFVLPEGTTLQERFAVPKGYTRIPYQEGSFGSFVRNYPMKPDGSPVLLWTKEPKANQGDHAAVFDMMVEEEMDVQQCADSVMRIYAEYFRKTGQYDRIKFHFVGGFLCDYNTYIQGYRLRENGDEMTWKKTKSAEDSDDVFNEYMFMVCAYASTLSMKEESAGTSLEDLRIGDVFLKAGSPGHVVMVADICEKDGKKAFLLAQSYMPAQEFHVIKNPRHENDPWYYEEEVQYPFRTQAYTFPEGSLRRLSY